MEGDEKRVTQTVDIKGIRDGLLIRVSDRANVPLVEALGDELARKQAFLAGSRVAVDVGDRALDGEQLAALGQLFAAHELTLWAVLAADVDTRDAARRAGLATRLSGSATVIGDLVWVSTLARNPRQGRTIAFNARTGAREFTFPDGRYATPVGVKGRLIVTGVRTLYGLAPRG